MINKQLEININNEKILERLSSNLNIDFISDGSNLRKIANSYSVESINFANGVDSAIANGFLTTMSSSFLENLGRQYNVYRKRYNNIALYSYQEVVQLTVNQNDSLISSITNILMPFRKGDVIYSDENVIIESTSDIFIADIVSPTYISVRITMAVGLSEYSIREGVVFQVTPTNKDVTTNIPTLNLKFNKPVGLSVIEESEEDYRLRLYEATYLANNGANSILSALTKEIPLLYFIETDDYKIGRSIKTIYPYTQELIDNGVDSSIPTYIIPLLETNIQSKILYGQLIDIVEPTPLLINIFIDFTNNANQPTNSYLNNIQSIFNRVFVSHKVLDKQLMISFLNNYLSDYDLKTEDFRFEFTSNLTSEETFNLGVIENTSIPLGRFLRINTIRSEVVE